VFLDANVLFSAAYRDRSALLGLWKGRGRVLMATPSVVEEARRSLDTSEQRARQTRLLRRVTLVAEPAPRALPVEVAAKDRHVLLGAIDAGATHLLTGDRRHFGAHFGRKVAGVLIQLPAEHLGK